MTIEKGQAWGEPGALPPDGRIVADDTEASLVLQRARAAGTPYPVLGLAGGDLCRTLGGHDEMMRPGEGTMVFPLDLGEVLVDGKLHLFVAHVVAHDRLWRRSFVAMNAQWRRGWNLGPKAHPNDGVLDTYRAELGIADRLKILKRLPTGSHLPHPGIKVERAASVIAEFKHPISVEVDGRSVGRARHIAVRVEPDALRVVI